MEKLTEYLIQTGALKTPRIINAFRAIDRADFVLPEDRGDAYVDAPLSIGYGQTISQPTTVAMLLEWLAPEPGDKVLDVGSGSSWTTTLLAHIASKPERSDLEEERSDEKGRTFSGGRVIGVELIPELAEFGRKNIAKYNFIASGIAEIRNESAENGFPEDAPFNRILSGASAKEIPRAWEDQLAVDGHIVTPIGNSVLLLTKNPDGSFKKEEHPGFAFVPFIR